MQRPEHAQKTILVVEDDVSISEIIALALADETPFAVSIAYNAQDAQKKLHEIIPALFLLDYQLPGITGLQFYDQLQKTLDFAEQPTIMMSANLPWEEIKKRHIIGLQKPFEIDELIEIVLRLIH